MITELLGVTGSGMVGIMLGLYEKRQKYAADTAKLKQMSKVQDAKALVDHLKAVSDKPFHGLSAFMLTATVCLCALLCINEPSAILWTFHPDSSPVKFDFLFIHWQGSSNKVYEITTGGVAYALLHAMVLQVGRVVSGVR